MKMIRFSILICFIVLFSLSCKKEEDKNYYEFKEAGNIHFKLTGVSVDGLTMNEDANFNCIDMDASNYTDTMKQGDGSMFRYFNIYLYSYSAGIGFNSIYLNFALKDNGEIADEYLSINYLKKLENNKVFVYEYSTPWNDDNLDSHISEVKYENNTVTGKFSLDDEKINIKGDFNVPVKKLVR